jgi:hypothetical protein
MGFHIQRILPQQHLSQPQSHRVCAGSFDAGTRNPGIDVSFADACQSFVGVNLNNNVILRGAGRAYVEVWI